MRVVVETFIQHGCDSFDVPFDKYTDKIIAVGIA